MSADGWVTLEKGWGVDALGQDNVDHWLVRAGIALSVQEACRIWQRELPRGSALLDVGCGRQPYRPWIEQCGLTYHGIDRYVEGCASDASTTRAWDITRIPWPFDDMSFDAVLCTEVLEHVPDPFVLVEECARICRPGSLLILTAPFVWPEHEAPYDYHRFTRYGLKAIVERCGFKTEALWARGNWSETIAQLLGFASIHHARGWRAQAARSLIKPIRALVSCLDPAQNDPQFALPLGFSLVARRVRRTDAGEAR
jgi:SAM-dependent methyltransferase